jgi:integrase/recombinase XerD
LNTGIRLDELCHLRFQDFNSEEKILHARARSDGGGAKGDKGRDIPITDLLLKKYQAYLADYRLKQDIVENFVFLSRNGTPLNTRAVQHRMTSLRNKLGFRVHTHRSRTTFATNLHKSGDSIYTISLLIGHEDISTTKNYILVTRAEQRQAIGKGTPLGRIEEEAKAIEELHGEKADLIAEINELIENQQGLLNRVRNL